MKKPSASLSRAHGGEREAGKAQHVVPLDLPVPAGILVMDLGGGLRNELPRERVSVDSIACVPFKAIVRGMLRPGAWHVEPVALSTGDFLSSMMRMPDITNAVDSTAGYNIAVISRDYVNMSIRFGYHFNMIDCYCSEKAKNNHSTSGSRAALPTS